MHAETNRAAIIAGGLCLVIGALAFVGVFSYLASEFDYPAVLDGPAETVLPRLRDGGPTMRAVWALYAFLPLLLLPGAIGARAACPSSPSRMRLAVALNSIASLSMCLGLMRWPSIHWRLAAGFEAASVEGRKMISVVFDGLNLYLGNYVGEFLGEVTLAGFFILTGASMLDEAFRRWIGWCGIAFGVLFIAGAFRNVLPAVGIVADLNNALLPLWMIVLGASFVVRGWRRLPGVAGEPESAAVA